MLAYKLDKNIDSNKLISDIQKLVSKHSIANKEHLLVVRIIEIAYNDESPIPKLEHHNI